jgi:hypothetical protein
VRGKGGPEALSIKSTIGTPGAQVAIQSEHGLRDEAVFGHDKGAKFKALEPRHPARDRSYEFRRELQQQNLATAIPANSVGYPRWEDLNAQACHALRLPALSRAIQFLGHGRAHVQCNDGPEQVALRHFARHIEPMFQVDAPPETATGPLNCCWTQFRPAFSRDAEPLNRRSASHLYFL